MRKETVPSPCPSCPPVIVIHGAVLVAVHVHSRATLTATDPVPPPDAKLVEGMASVAWQRVGAVGGARLVCAVLPHPAGSEQTTAKAEMNCRVGTGRAIVERKCTTAANSSSRTADEFARNIPPCYTREFTSA
jgi:hypothetical protein